MGHAKRDLPPAPPDADALFRQGRDGAAAGRMDDAVERCRGVLARDPDRPDALADLATALAARGQVVEAAELGRRARALAPGDAEIANNCAVVLHQGGRTAEAAEGYRDALALDPSHAGAWANLGVALQELFRFDEAVWAFAGALAARPGFALAKVEAIKIRRHICDWSRFAADNAELLALVGEDTDAVFMLLLMSFPSTAAQQLACARQHMARLPAEPPVAAAPRPPGDRLRVGYLSGDFRDHPVGRLLPELLAQHDRGAVEVVGYALGLDDPGRVRARIRRGCERFVDLHGLSDGDAAARIAADGVDVLVDLTGPTAAARLGILARRPAPVQASFLGWPGTTGAGFIDYVVGDPFLIPADHAPSYSERIVQLPHCYQPSDPYRAAVLPALTRADCGLPERAFVFCSFNNTSKLTPDVFALWLELLGAVEDSVLWLYGKTPRAVANLLAFAAERGVGAGRIVFAPVSSVEVYLARLRLADLFLDAFPYNAGATCNDALWMGLPVVTMAGDTYVSRMAGSLLRAAGLPELITASPEAYRALALRLATEPDLAAAVRRRLADRHASPLFDMPRFAAAWERALGHMGARGRAGLPPAAFAIPDADRPAPGRGEN